MRHERRPHPAGHPVFGVAATVCAYVLAAAAHRALGRPALLHPVLTATAALALMRIATGISYETYFLQAFPLHVALGVLVVLLAVPLWRQFHVIRAARWPITVTLLLGSSTALATALVLPISAGHGVGYAGAEIRPDSGSGADL